jgi:hypothetical protein
MNVLKSLLSFRDSLRVGYRDPTAIVGSPRKIKDPSVITSDFIVNISSFSA